MSSLIITPKTKVGQVLDAYPQLESVLLEISPAFAKLRNPVLRKTVAKVASLQQAALVGNVEVSMLVNRLRSAVGQQELSIVAGLPVSTAKPEWFHANAVTGKTEVAKLLESGQQPIHAVLGSLKALQSGTIHEVESQFLPAPLIEKAESIGYRYWVDQRSDSEFHVYFQRIPS